MISESHTRYGSGASPGSARHGSLRRWRSYQASRSAARGPAPARFRRTDVPASVIATDRVAERAPVNKPRPSYPRPLAELLNKCLSDAFARQGFASREIVTHWPEIVGSEIAANAEP